MTTLKAQLPITVVVPAYNAERYILEALRSVSEQHELPSEVIVIDDGSGDHTVEVVEAFAETAPIPIRWYKQPNAGPAAARNNAIRRASHPWIAQLDADDIMLPSQLSTLYRALMAEEGVVVAFGDQEVLCNGEIRRTSFLQDKAVASLLPYKCCDGVSYYRDSIFYALLSGNSVPTSAALIRRECLTGGAYDESLRTSEDRELMVRLSLLGPFARVPEVLAQKREHEQNLTNKRNRLMLRRNALLSLIAIADKSDRLNLDFHQRDAVQQAICSAGNRVLKAAADEGWTALKQMQKDFHRHLSLSQVLRPSIALRLMKSAVMHASRTSSSAQRLSEG